MPKIRLQTAYDKRGRPILMHSQGQMDGGDAVDLGMLWYEPKGENDPFAGTDGFYYFPDHPKNEEAVRRIRMVFKERGYVTRVSILDGKGEDAKDLLLPSDVPILQRRFVSLYGGDVRQAGSPEMTLADKLIVKYHHHLANAAVLLVIEDYEPDKMGAAFGVQGEVWGFCQTLGGQFRKLTGYDFQITLCETVWAMLRKQPRTWLMDHELMHADRTERGRWSIRDHDIQMFTEEVERYPNMDSSIRKIDALVQSKYEVDTDEDDVVDDEPEEIIEPTIKKRKKKKKKAKKGGMVVTASMAAARKAARNRIGLSVVPPGFTQWLRDNPNPLSR